MKKIAMVLAIMILALTVQTAEAHPHGKTGKKQYAQHQRINHGVRNGTLTRREAAVLRMQQNKIRNYKKMAAADGRITPNERVIINRAQRHAHRNIYRQKHDGQYRRW